MKSIDNDTWTKIREFVLSGASCYKAALQFGVSPSTVYARAKKEEWKREGGVSCISFKRKSKMSERSGYADKVCKGESYQSKCESNMAKENVHRLEENINNDSNSYERDAMVACQVAVDRALLKAALGLMEAETNISKAMEPVDKALKIKRELAKESKEHGSTTVVVETIVPEPIEEVVED